MNILIAATHMRRSNGGVCTHIIDLCKEFAPVHNVVLIADGSDYDDVLANIPNLTYIQLPLNLITKSLSVSIGCFRRILRIVKQYNINIVHLHSQRLVPFAWILYMFTKVPFLWTNHIDAIPNEKVFVWMCRLFRFPIISVSSDLKKMLEGRIRHGNICVVHNGIDVARFEPLSAEECDRIKAEYNIDDKSFVIAEVARITHVKGQHMLVRAIRTVLSKHPDWTIKVLIAGSGNTDWLQEQVLDYADSNKIDCTYLGFCDPREIYGISDLAVLPSIYEGFSLSSIEALAMGCPVIRSKTPGYADMEEIVLGHETGDVNDLADKIEYAFLHTDEMRRMAQQGRNSANGIFTKESMARNTMAVYERILRGESIADK